MDKKYVQVYIEWDNKDLKWPQMTSKGIRLCPQIKFEKEGNTIPMWTAEVVITKFDGKSTCYADLKYLFDHAPTNLLRKNEKFQLFDGPNPIAKGEVLTDLD